MTGRSSRYRTRYRVGTLRNRPVYWHPAEGYCVEWDGAFIVELSGDDEAHIVFDDPATSQGMARLIDHCAENVGLVGALPSPLWTAIRSRHPEEEALQ